MGKKKLKILLLVPVDDVYYHWENLVKPKSPYRNLNEAWDDEEENAINVFNRKLDLLGNLSHSCCIRYNSLN